ncbi:unnamed protein product, partial [Mesorhabditis belari]|uniref:Molybdate-anion transporter n=1 Tax=Mesorhabditis belari TaxID=2138241 RepID=A0AAF3JBF4_9BILA
MDFSLNTISYSLAIFLFVLSAVYLYLKERKERFKRDSAQNNLDFRGLQKLFIPPYLIVLLAESLQAPFLYVLYHSYRFIPSQIAALHVTGLISCLLISSITNRLIHKYSTRLLCLTCLSTAAIACVFKFSDSFLLLFISRVLDGVSAGLVTTPFQEWYTERHVGRMDFPPEWIENTFTKVATGAAFGAVIAGWLSQTVEQSTGVIAMPFALSALFMIIAGFIVGGRWDGGMKPSSTDPPATLSFSKELAILFRQPVALVLSVITIFTESALQIFVFVWSPILLKSKAIEGTNLGFGAAYACLMAFSLIGALLFHSPISKRIPTSRMLAIALFCSVFTLYFSFANLPETSLSWKHANFTKLLLAFCLFEATVGVLSPALGSLKAELTPTMSRGSIIGVPVTVISSLCILFLHPLGDAQQSLIGTALGLLIMAAFLGILLDLVLASRGREAPRPLSVSAPRPISSLPSVHHSPSQG